MNKKTCKERVFWGEDYCHFFDVFVTRKLHPLTNFLEKALIYSYLTT